MIELVEASGSRAVSVATCWPLRATADEPLIAVSEGSAATSAGRQWVFETARLGGAYFAGPVSTLATGSRPVVPAEWAARAAAAVQLLDRWLAEDPSYDRETFEELRAALDRDRRHSRRLFGP